MIKVAVKKMWGGKVSVRSYLVEYGIKTNQPLKIVFEGQEMVILPEKLKNYTCENQEFTAKRTDKYIRAGEKYKLYDYEWIPQKNYGWTEKGLKHLFECYKKVFKKKL